MDLDKEQPAVTLVCITYNHENYIAEALDSFVSQVTTFPYKVFVGDDCSTDKTPEIIAEYAEKYPDIIVPFLRKTNMGAQRNLVDMCEHATTPYIAFCEGDDYLINPNKLQIQYEYMEKHPKYRACFHNTMIQADPDWYLNSYYKPDKQGRRLIPGSIPGYNKKLKSMKMDYYIQFGPAHTSSMFFRWDYDLEIPEWYYTHIFGDHPMMMLQAGNGRVGFIPEVMSVYRRSEVGIIMYNNKNEHFLKTRESWMDVLLDLEQYFSENYGMFANAAIRTRMTQEGINYLDALVSADKWDKIHEFLDAYPKVAGMVFKTLMQNRSNWLAINKLISNESVKQIMNEPSYIKNTIEKNMKKTNKKEFYSSLRYRMQYWLYGLLPKKKNLWLFTSINNMPYNNNTRHLYEYIVAYHPEIEAVWLTKNKYLMTVMQSSNMPMVNMRSKQARKILKKAAIVFTNDGHSIDYRLKGFNFRTKVVQLGDGNSLKKPELDDKMKRASFKAYEKLYKVPGDSLITCGKKVLRRIKSEAIIEKYHNYFMMLVNNEYNKEKYKELYHLPEDRFLVCGGPRNNPVNNHEPDNGRKHVLYAPEIRKSARVNECIINAFIDHIPKINESAQKNGYDISIYLPFQILGQFKVKIENLALEYPYIHIVNTTDVYSELPLFDVMITDYSDLYLDYLLYNRPIIYLITPEEMEAIAEKLEHSYEHYTPGKKVVTWVEAIGQIEHSLKHPAFDERKRRTVCKYFFGNHTNHNAETIVNEIKQRMKML